ncbi:MAG: redoxin family protein [Ferruginibacter sp.]
MVKNFLLILCFCLSTLPVMAGVDKDSVPTFKDIYAYEIQDVTPRKNIHVRLQDQALSLFVFLSPECPLCQNYTKILNALSTQFNKKLRIIGIVPGTSYSATDITDFAEKYHTLFSIGIDQQQLLTKYLAATVTPQVVLIDSVGNLVYKGAIDDWVVGLGKKKESVTRHYTADAITQYLQSMPVKIKTTKAYGCKINDL